MTYILARSTARGDVSFLLGGACGVFISGGYWKGALELRGWLSPFFGVRYL